MKSLEELKAIKAKMQDKVVLRTSGGTTRIVVGMATCGIAAGARPVLNAFVEGVSEAGLGEPAPLPVQPRRLRPEVPPARSAHHLLQ